MSYLQEMLPIETKGKDISQNSRLVKVNKDPAGWDLNGCPTKPEGFNQLFNAKNDLYKNTHNTTQYGLILTSK